MLTRNRDSTLGQRRCGSKVELLMCGSVDFLVHCSMLAEDAIKSAISNYYTKNPKAQATDLSGKAASSLSQTLTQTAMA